MRRPQGLFILDPETYDLVYAPHREAIGRHVDLIGSPQTSDSIRENTNLLQDAELIFSGWGLPKIDNSFLDQAPNLRAIFYAAGGFDTAPAHRRGIAVTVAHLANSRPVAEYTLATILFSLKHGWRLSRELHQEQRFIPRNAAPGCYQATVGLISMGAVARLLLPLLKPFDLNVVAYDPYLSEAEADALGVERVSLDELFRRSDVVSLHSPEIPQTRRMIGGAHLAAMKPGATFINTARGAIVRQDELIEAAKARPDLQFVLDVTDPEVLPRGHALYGLANVVITPHIAGSAGGECRRLGQYMVEELERYIEGKPLKWQAQPTANPTPKLALVSEAFVSAMPSRRVGAAV